MNGSSQLLNDIYDVELSTKEISRDNIIKESILEEGVGKGMQDFHRERRD